MNFGKVCLRSMLLLGISLSSYFSTKAQYNKIGYDNSNYPELIIEQIDQYDYSTVIHFSYTSITSLELNGSEDIQLISNGKAKKLLNSYNLPLDEKKHLFNDSGEKLNFSLEFEKIDNVNDAFSVQSATIKKFNLPHLKVDSSQSTEFLNVDAFISKTPSREFYIFYNEGSPVLRYAYKGMIIAIKLAIDENYGKFFQPQIFLQNYNKKDILLDPSKIYAQYEVKSKFFTAPIFDYKKYISMVKKIQKSEMFWNGLSEGLAAVAAGYSFISSNSNTYVTANGRSLNYGFFGNNMYAGTSSTSITGSTNTKSNSTVFNGGNAYIAAQYARQNLESLKAKQVDRLTSIQNGYIKMNTIFPNSEYSGYCNIPFRLDINSFLMKVEINGSDFFFEWDNDKLNSML